MFCFCHERPWKSTMLGMFSGIFFHGTISQMIRRFSIRIWNMSFMEFYQFYVVKTITKPPMRNCKHTTYLWWWLGDGLFLFEPHYVFYRIELICLALHFLNSIPDTIWQFQWKNTWQTIWCWSTMFSHASSCKVTTHEFNTEVDNSSYVDIFLWKLRIFHINFEGVGTSPLGMQRWEVLSQTWAIGGFDGPTRLVSLGFR